MKEISKSIYVFIGPPGSGKGSLSSLCVKNLGWTQLSTGNLCRKHIDRQSEIGKQIDFAIKSGKLISDELITNMVEEWFSHSLVGVNSVILDGYPRTVAQAKAFSDVLNEKLSHLTLKVVRFFISDEAVVKRLSSRYVCQNKDCQAVYSLIPESSLAPQKVMVCDVCSSPLGKRADDEPDSVRERLSVYHRHEQDLINFYLAHNYPVIEFNVEKSLQNVFEEFKRLLCLNTL